MKPKSYVGMNMLEIRKLRDLLLHFRNLSFVTVHNREKDVDKVIEMVNDILPSRE